VDIDCGRRLAVATSNTIAVSCVEVFLTVRAMPEVEVLDDLNNAVARFAYRRGGSINLTCATAPDIVIGVSPSARSGVLQGFALGPSLRF
jgi:hypothetical protein